MNPDWCEGAETHGEYVLGIASLVEQTEQTG
jgi:hypothetical protein